MNELRIKELAKQKGLTMQDIAEALNINRVNLSNSLNGNPTLERLRQVAKVLGVEISDLFQSSTASILYGFVEYNGEIFKISSPEDLFRLSNKVKLSLQEVPAKE